MDKECEFPNCKVTFEIRDRGCARRKYCKPHSELIRKTKLKGYREKYEIKTQRRVKKPDLTIRKVFLRKCFDCPEYLPMDSSLARKYCGECYRKRCTIASNRCNHRRTGKRTFDRILKSIKGNLNAWINIKPYE